MRCVATRFLSLTAAAAVVLALAACGGSSSASSSGPIVIGASLSLTGDFSTDGQAFERGYQLWANYVNSHGGLLGRKVKLDILNDASSQTTVTTNYTKLITSDHADLVFGPFSTLLTVPSASVAHRYGKAMIEGAGGGPAVFQLKLNNVFDVSPTIADQLVPFANWVASLPAGQRPTSAAYPMVNDPFADPMVQTAQAILARAGVKTVYNKIYPAENPDYKTGADQVAASGAQMVVLGSVDVPTASAFITAFEQQHYNPKIFAASAGPDQGQAFLSAVGAHNVTGIMVPGGWYGGVQNPLSEAMVHAYIAKFGGTPAGINADVAEAYSVGEVAAAAVDATKSLDNTKIINYLHSGVSLQTVQGPAKFNSIGENVAASMYVFQWQSGGTYKQVLPLGAMGDSPIVNPRPAWGKG
ncbi:MAG TPA: amino acid ABC transporter substrate-binding protein [Streptosporangiaceae bacterium]|nr:amino acid ABC transporter substrate-binding protein [Streptosporangiaceae bacterium]